MPLTSQSDLQRAMEEFHRLAEAPPGSDAERRRRDLDADIKAYVMTHPGEFNTAKPEGSVA